MITKGTDIVIGMSGGVDSSVAALLLQQQGFNVIGLFMKNWEEDDTGEYCAASVDLADAQSVCDQLGIPLHTVNFSSEYWDRVFSYFLAEYSAGRTPNPDVLCNKEIKFKAFLEHARGLGAEYIATGHYAQRVTRDGIHHLRRASDTNKDQTYFLYTLGQQQLAHSLFPLGCMEKPQVRHIAAEQGFVNRDKKDSTGICFIGERKFKDFLAKYLPAQPGEITTPEGKVVGQHDGLMYYTLGQRQGLGIGGRREAGDAAWFVAGKDLEHNRLIAVQGHDHPLLFSNGLSARDLHWVNPLAVRQDIRCTAKTRYRQGDQACSLQIIDAHSCRVNFDQPQRAVTPGQSVVFYDGDDCLGGGVIESTFVE